MMRTILFFLSMLLLLSGCAKENVEDGYNSVQGISGDQNIAQELKEESILTHGEDNKEETIVGSIGIEFLPEWLLAYTELGQMSENIYLSRGEKRFTVENEHIVFPECNILIVAAEIAGRDKVVIQGNRDNIVGLIENIEKAKVVDEMSSINPDGSILGLDFSIIILTVDGEYLLTRFTLFDDGRINIHVDSDNAENNSSLWIKSAEIVDEILSISNYARLDEKKVDEIIGVEIYDKNGRIYQLEENEIEKMRSLLTHRHIINGDQGCPFDIKIIFSTKNDQIYAKFCNDDCRIMAIEGEYFELKEQDSQWINNMIIDNLNNNMY